MGPKMAGLAGAALQFLPACPFFEDFTRYFWCPEAAHWLPAISPHQSMGASGQAAGVIAGVSLVIFMWIVLAYSWATIAVGQVVIYLILRRKKDDENLLERDDDEQKPESRPGAGEMECESFDIAKTQPESASQDEGQT
jgi:hypothetical protein